MPMLVDQDPSPLKGVISLAGVLPFASASGSSPMRIVVVVVVAAAAAAAAAAAVVVVVVVESILSI